MGRPRRQRSRSGQRLSGAAMVHEMVHEMMHEMMHASSLVSVAKKKESFRKQAHGLIAHLSSHHHLTHQVQYQTTGEGLSCTTVYCALPSHLIVPPLLLPLADSISSFNRWRDLKRSTKHWPSALGPPSKARRGPSPTAQRLRLERPTLSVRWRSA